MEFFRNIQPETPARLEDLITVHEGQIISMALSRVENAQIILLSLAKKELITEEAYWGDTLYYVVSGELSIEKEDTRYTLTAGDVMAVSAHVGHALEAIQNTKLLQIQINK